MQLIAQEIITEAQDINKQFELFEIVEMEDINGEKFQIRKPIGTFTRAGLEQQKMYNQQQIDSITNEIASIDEKLALMV